MKIVCIPAYNEENTIADIVTRSFKFADKVIVCDDGSSDFTSKKAEHSGAIVIKHSKNSGKGKSLQSLFEYVKKLDFDVLVTIDGDGQFLPEEIPKLKKLVENNSVDIVIGNRFSDISEMPNYRKFGNKILDRMTNLASELSIEDSQSGYRAYSKKSIEEIKFDINGFGSDAEILIDAAKKGFRISEEKVKVIYNTGMKTSTKNPIHHSGEVITSLLEIIAIKSPLKFMGIPGAILLVIGIIFAINVVSVFNETSYFSIAFTLAGITFFVVGSMLVLIAVLLYSISRISTKNQTD